MSAEGVDGGSCVLATVERGALLICSGSNVMNELMLIQSMMKMMIRMNA